MLMSIISDLQTGLLECDIMIGDDQQLTLQPIWANGVASIMVISPDCIVVTCYRLLVLLQ